MVAPRLSELQAKLRTGTEGPSPSGGLARPTQAKMPPGIPKQGAKRPPATEDGPPKKRPMLGQQKVPITKTPAKAKSAVPGLSAKTPGNVTPPATLEEGPSTSAKSGGLVAFQKATVPQGPPAKRGAIDRPPSAAGQDGSMHELLSFAEAQSPSFKQRHAVELAETLGSTMGIEYINTFLCTLRTKIMERAQGDGVQAVPSAPKAAPKAAANATGDTVDGATATTPKSAALPQGAKGAPAAKGGPPPKAPKEAPMSKITMAKAALSKSAGMMAKASVAKAPAAPAKAVIAKVPPKQLQQQVAKPAPTASTSKASPPASPNENVPDDALYQLVGELTEDPVVQDGLILEDRLNEVFRRLWDGAARKPKDWVAAWQALGIPGDRQGEALQKLLNLAFVQTEDPDKAPLVLAELVKGHKVKMRNVEDVFVSFGQNLDGILAINEEAWQLYAKFLVHVFPKPQTAGWGWSRVGWDFKGWWQFCERCLQSLEPSRSFDVMGLVLRLCQDKEGMPIHSCQVWLDGDRLAKILAKLCDLGGCELAEVGERLELLGVHAMEGTD